MDQHCTLCPPIALWSEARWRNFEAFLLSGTQPGASTKNACSCCNSSDSSVKCWGKNLHGQLGLGDTNNRGDAGGEMRDALPAIDLGF